MVEYEERNLTTKDSHRDEIIDALVKYDASTFIDIQKQVASFIINDIRSHSEGFETQANSIVQKRYREEHPDDPDGRKMSPEERQSLSKRVDELADTLRKKYANDKCQMGNGSLNYCIGLQRYACNKANEKIGYSIMPDISMSCDNARTFFEQCGKGKYYSQISECFNLEDKQPKLDNNGNHMLRDGDLMLIIDPSDNDAFHCLLVNVDENNKATYTAGNGEAINGNLGYWAKEGYACYVIPTSQIVTDNAKNHYQSMSNEELFDAYSTKIARKISEKKHISDKETTPKTEHSDLPNTNISLAQRIENFRGLSLSSANISESHPRLNKTQNQEDVIRRIQMLQTRKSFLRYA